MRSGGRTGNLLALNFFGGSDKVGELCN